VGSDMIADYIILFVRLLLHCKTFKHGIGTKLNRHFGGWHAASTSRVEKIEL
jgi:hypothetical protein